MDDDSPLTQTNCAGCPRCAAEGCLSPPGEEAGTPEGCRLVFGAIGLFLMPLVLAIVGAKWLGTTGVMQFLGGLAGLAVGMTASVVAGRIGRCGKGCP